MRKGKVQTPKYPALIISKAQEGLNFEKYSQPPKYLSMITLELLILTITFIIY